MIQKKAVHNTPIIRLSTLVLLAGVSLASTSMAASVQYITDEFNVTMRSGMGTDHKIVSMLPSGHRLEVLGRDADKGYTQVRDEAGKSGYVLTRFLVDTPSARDRLATAETRLEQLRQAPDQLASELDALKTAHASLVEEHSRTSAENHLLQQQLEDFRQTFAQPAKIAAERDQLRQQLAKLIRESEELRQDKRELENDANRWWFLLGGGAVILGIILGMILPYFKSPRRSSSWSSL